MSELKPCPFSGETPYFKSDVKICCDESNVLMVGVQGREELARVWNTRVAPKVKPLEWRTPWVGTSEFVETECSTIIGLYRIIQDEKSKRYYVSYSMMGVEVGLKEDDEFNNIDQAKQAAQSHYEKTVLEALE